MSPLTLKESLEAIYQGKVLAYATESIYGLGCDALSEDAVNAISMMKKRQSDKGYIVLVGTVAQALEWISPAGQRVLEKDPDIIRGVTMVFPSSSSAPPWCVYRGHVAIRMSTHLGCLALCRASKRPLISTSANISGQMVLNTPREISATFANHPAFSGVMQGGPGGQKASTVCHAITGEIFRA